jgi:hypothetical protein
MLLSSLGYIKMERVQSNSLYVMESQNNATVILCSLIWVSSTLTANRYELLFWRYCKRLSLSRNGITEEEQAVAARNILGYSVWRCTYSERWNWRLGREQRTVAGTPTARTWNWRRSAAGCSVVSVDEPVGCWTTLEHVLPSVSSCEGREKYVENLLLVSAI